MTEPACPQPPAWIHKRDGRLVPFEADKISRALFAATESLGQPNAFLARELTSHSLTEIGAAFGGKDHTTIIHAYEKIEDLLVTDITLLAEVNSLKKQLTEGNYSL